MKINKAYLKDIIKEELNKVLNESDTNDEVLVRMKASDFLKLTTDQQTRDYLKKRFSVQQMDYYYARAGDLSLVVNQYYKVRDHEGRNRAYANIQKNGPDAENNVLITIQNGRYDDLVGLDGQLEDVFVPVKNFKVIEQNIEDKVSNFLDYDTPIKFKADVFPPNPYMPNERVVSCSEQFIEFINKKYPEYAFNYRKLNNIKDFVGNERSEFYKNYIDQINRDFNINDSQGPLKILHKGFRNIELDRMPDPKDTILFGKK